MNSLSSNLAVLSSSNLLLCALAFVFFSFMWILSMAGDVKSIFVIMNVGFLSLFFTKNMVHVFGMCILIALLLRPGALGAVEGFTHGEPVVPAPVQKEHTVVSEKKHAPSWFKNNDRLGAPLSTTTTEPHFFTDEQEALQMSLRALQ